MSTAALTLLHLLVFVYWLGGDLGAFVASFLVGRPSEAPAARAAAARILSQVDRAPGVALILAFPTGLTLANARGWLGPPTPTALLAAVWGLAAAWLWLFWRLHGPKASTSRLLSLADLTLRWGAILLLLGLAVAGGWGDHQAPLFVRIKLALLAGAIALGLAIRRVVAPFGPAFGRLMAEGPSPGVEAVIGPAMARARIVVASLWLLVTVAAVLGLWKPL